MDVQASFFFSCFFFFFFFSSSLVLLPARAQPLTGVCASVAEEVAQFWREGEPVILEFPMFGSVLRRRGISARGLNITRGNGGGFGVEGRVQQQEDQLWILPGRPEDSGEYTCTYRNGSFCISSSLRLQVFRPSARDLWRSFFRWNVPEGEVLQLSCPHLGAFNHSQTLISWSKDPQTPDLVSNLQEGGKLLIPAVRRQDAGLYTCQLPVLIHNQPYRLSRTYQIRVQGPVATVTDPTTTSDPRLLGSSTIDSAGDLAPLAIVSPLNGTAFQAEHGSGIEMSCEVLTGCGMADSTLVTWLVNGMPVEWSYLSGRAVQGGRRKSKVVDGCLIEVRLAVISVTEQDTNTELRCSVQNRRGKQEVIARLHVKESLLTWVVVGVVASACFLSVASAFLCLLLRTGRNKKVDYILARQNSVA